MKMNYRKIRLTQGVPMGSKWSPLCFNLFTAIVKRDLYNKYINDAIIIEYADDIIMKVTKEKAKEVIYQLELTYKQVGLKINYDKSEILIEKDLEKMDFKKLEIIIDLRNRFGFKLVNNIRYLGKWVKQNQDIIFSGEDEFKKIGNINYFKNLAWDLQLEYCHLFIFAKRRYLIQNEQNKKKLKKLFQELLKKIRFIRSNKIMSYWDIIEIINFKKIWINKIYLKENRISMNTYEFINKYLRLLKSFTYNPESKFDQMINKIIEIAEKNGNLSLLGMSADELKKIDDKNILNLNDKFAFIKVNKIIIELSNSINYELLTNFLWDNDLRKMELASLIYRKEWNEIKKNKILNLIVVLIYEAGKIYVSKLNYETIIETIIHKEIYEEYKIDNVKLTNMLKMRNNYSKYNIFDVLNKYPNLNEFEQDLKLTFEEYEKDMNEKIEDFEMNWKINDEKKFIKELRNQEYDLTTLDENFKEIINKYKEIIKFRKSLVELWEVWKEKNKKNLISFYSEKFDKTRKYIEQKIKNKLKTFKKNQEEEKIKWIRNFELKWEHFSECLFERDNLEELLSTEKKLEKLWKKKKAINIYYANIGFNIYKLKKMIRIINMSIKDIENFIKNKQKKEGVKKPSGMNWKDDNLCNKLWYQFVMSLFENNKKIKLEEKNILKNRWKENLDKKKEKIILKEKKISRLETNAKWKLITSSK